MTNRFGPKLSPTSIAKGWAGTRAAKSDAAGRLLSSTDEAAATTAVPQRSRCDINVAGPDHTRPKVPRATATPKSPTSTGTPSTSVACLTSSLPPMIREPTTTDADGGHWDRGVVQDDDQHGRRRNHDETESEDGSICWGWVLHASPQSSVLGHGEDRCGHDQRGQRGQPGVGEELAAREVEVTDDDQVGQVGAGQEQRAGIGEEETSVEQRRLTLSAAPGGVDENGREERHRGIEVQHGCHRTHDGDGPDEEKDTVRRHAGQTVARCREQSIFVGDEANQQQPDNENERCPVLGHRHRAADGYSAVATTNPATPTPARPQPSRR